LARFRDALIIMVDLCQVCDNSEKKYCCPTCKIKYCSLVCYKSHKDFCSAQPISHSVDTAPSEEVVYQYQTSNTVPVDRLQELAKSDNLKQLLQNPHLRDFLTRLDSADNPVRLMRSAMQEPIFLEFVDTCLDIIDPDKDKNLTDEQIVEEVANCIKGAAEED